MSQYPQIHNFPPFYTKQSNATVLENQLNQWCTLILQTCEQHRIYSVLPLGGVLRQQQDQPRDNFFENKAIERSAAPEFRKEILSHLVHRLGRGSYVDNKTPDAGVLVMWRTLREWAELLYGSIEATGQQGSVLTVYEMTMLEDQVVDEEFRNIDPVLFERILQELRRQGRAQILMSDDGGEIGGVKFG